VPLDLLPGAKPEQIQRMWLEIPLKDQEAPLFHYCAFEGMRRNYAGATPRGGKITWTRQPYDSVPATWEGGTYPPIWKAEPGSDDGVIWTCRDTYPWYRVIDTDFVPYIFLGGGERGLAFFGANDKGYLLDPNGTVQTIERRGGTLFLRVDLVNKPSAITRARHLVFGLQAAPTRPSSDAMRASTRLFDTWPATGAPRSGSNRSRR
jgi:hypothetical protein